jgi:SAM-dependent methyltransferase
MAIHEDRGVDTGTTAYYDRVAADYDQQVDGLPVNRILRDGFRAHVSRLAGHASAILDFGCGTGSDAAWYAARGHRVVAYDSSAGMLDVLRVRCATEIADGRVLPIAGGLRELETTLKRLPPVSAVAANFAVLNHFDDLAPLFCLLRRYLAPDGAVVASLLNPWYRGDWRRRWWWRALPRSLWTGTITARAEVTTHRHFVGTVRRMAEPQFAVADVGSIDESGWRPQERFTWRAASSPFLFVVLRPRA